MKSNKYKAPEGMLKAAEDALVEHFSGRHLPPRREDVKIAVEAALGWQARNPPEITTEMNKAARAYYDGRPFPELRYIFTVAYFYLGPEEVPKELEDLLCDLGITSTLAISRERFNKDILEAYRRGANSK